MNRVRILMLSGLVAGAALAVQAASVQGASAPAAEPARSDGARIYAKWCSDCHSTEGGSGSVALRRKYQGRIPAVLEQRSDLTPGYVRLAVRRGVSFMPSFRKTEISDAELARVVAYLVPPKESPE